MLTVHGLNKSYDSQLIFENVSFCLNPGERVGLVGPNGCGKSTLLRLLAGIESLSSGSISRDPRLRIGYLAQDFSCSLNDTFQKIIGQATGNADALEDELASAAAALALQPGDPLLEARYDDLLRRVQAFDDGNIIRVLSGLGLTDVDPGIPVGHLSGGQKTRLSLALVLLGDPQILLLDEPTNHLDITMLEWLENWLNDSPCGVLITSHDRTFLDRTVSRILDMDPVKHNIREYYGNYSNYLDQRQSEIDRQWAAYQDQQLKIRQMKQDIQQVKAQAAYTERQASSIRIGGEQMRLKGFKSYQQGIAKKVAKKAKSREKKLDRYLEDDERVAKPQKSWQVRFNFGQAPHLGYSVIQLERAAIGYTPAAPLLKDVTLSVHSGQRVAITGPNGSGKTTLLRTIVGELPSLEGRVSLGASVRLGYMSQDQSILDAELTAVETLNAYFANQTEIRRFLAQYLFTGDEPLKPVKLLSYGQRARLMLARLVAEQCNCLLLDEPINHLDIPSRTQFEQALDHFNGAVLAVVHDRYFIERFAGSLWRVENRKIQVQFL